MTIKHNFATAKPLGSKGASIAILALLLAACGGTTGEQPGSQNQVDAPRTVAASSPAPATTTESATETTAASATARPASFAQCIACHTDTPGQPSGIGPNIVGVFRKAAASKEDYEYSDALKGANLTWDEQTLDAFITSPQRVVSGTKMAFGGISNEVQRKELIEYLAQLE